MGFLDDLKKATAIGLTPQQHYDRAYEKGVLLGPAKFSEAAGMFDEAARRAGEANDAALHARATANARLYSFVVDGKYQPLADLAQVLPHLTEIEKIGARNEAMPANLLLAEVNARIAEYQIAEVYASNHQRLAVIHGQASAAFKLFFTHPLVTYRYQHADPHIETAQSRFFLHQGLASYHQALDAVHASPETAAEHMGKALTAFRQCNDGRMAEDAQAWLTSCQQKRTCWMCHREFQGARIHFRTYPAAVTRYAGSVVAALGQDTSTLDGAAGTVVLCAPCGSVLERQADAYATQRANEVRQHLEAQIAHLAATVTALSQKIHGLQILR